MHLVRFVSIRLTLTLALLGGESACAHANDGASPPTAAPAQPPASARTEPPSAPVDASAASKESILKEGRRWTQAFYDGHTQELWDHFDAGLRNVFGDKAGLDAFRDKALSQLGAESSVMEERVEPMNGVSAYVRIARFERAPMPIRLVVARDGEGRTGLLEISPDRQ